MYVQDTDSRKKDWKLTVFMREVAFHRAYMRACSADLWGPWLKRAKIPVKNGINDASGRMRRTVRNAMIDIE